MYLAGKLSVLRLSPVKTSSYFFSFPFFEFMMNAGEAHAFIRHQSINEGKVVLDVTVRGKEGGFQHETVASADIVHEKHKTPPLHRHLLHPASSLQSELSCVFIRTVPRLINDIANVTSNRKTLRLEGQLHRGSV